MENEMPPLFPKMVQIKPRKLLPKSPSLEKQMEEEQKYLEQLLRDKKPMIQKQIKDAGFSCLRCGQCCERTKGDNSVFVLPKEIEKIKAFLSQNEEFKDNAFLPQNEEFKDNAFLPQNGEFKDLIVSESDFVLPLFPDYYLENPENETISICFDTFLDILNFLKDQIDEVGRIHTFGRMLRRKENGACFFLDESTKKCKIYEVRPGLCRTYPFYPDGAGILECECCGFGSAAKTNISLTAELTDALEKRLFVELVDFKKTQFFLKEMAAQFQLNTDDGIKKAISNLHEGFLKFVIYDGSGVFEADVSLW